MLFALRVSEVTSLEEEQDRQDESYVRGRVCVKCVRVSRSAHLVVVQRETQFTLVGAQVVLHEVRVFVDVYGL